MVSEQISERISERISQRDRRGSELVNASTLDSICATTPVHETVITDSSAWSQADLSESIWSYSFDRHTWHEIERAAQAVLNQKWLGVEDMPLPALARDAARLLRELKSGRGFVVLKDLPVQQYTNAELGAVYQVICSFIGPTLMQNATGDRFCSVRDQGYDLNALLSNSDKLRGSMTSAALPFHTDSAPAFRGRTPDIFALLALQAAKLGGEMMLMSASTLHNLILEEHPEYLRRLYQPYHFDRRAELMPGESPTLFAPVFTYRDRLSMRYSIIRMLDGFKVAEVPMTAADQEPLDFIEQLMQRQELAVMFKLQRGEILLANNRLVLHSRTGFEDFSQPEQKRHMVRAWLQYSGSGGGEIN